MSEDSRQGHQLLSQTSGVTAWRVTAARNLRCSCPNTEMEGAMKIAQDIHCEVEKMGVVHSASTVSQQVTVSIGVHSMYPTSEQEPSKLIELADCALYTAKRSGRNRIECTCEDD